jgi:acyl-CoA thioesterase
MMTSKPPAKRRARAGIRNEQLIAERIVAAMMAKDQFSQWLGITVTDVGPRRATVSAKVRADMLNGFGVAHGGIAFSIADSAFAFACNTNGKITMSIENAITYPIAVALGDTLTAVAEAEGESNKIGYYRVVVRNQKDEVVALFRGTAFKTKNDHLPPKGATTHTEATEAAEKATDRATARAGVTATATAKTSK